MNNFLLSVPTDRDIISASNPRLGALFGETVSAFHSVSLVQ